MKISRHTRTITIDRLSVDGYEFDLSEILNILSELEDCDGFFTVLVIHDSDIAESLEKLGVIKKNIRGGCYPGEAYQKFADEVWGLLEDE